MSRPRAADLSLGPPHAGGGERMAAPPRDGRASRATIAGAALEARREARGLRLVVATQDAPFEKQPDTRPGATSHRSTARRRRGPVRPASSPIWGLAARPAFCSASSPARLTPHDAARVRFPFLAAATEAPGVSRRFGGTLALDD